MTFDVFNLFSQMKYMYFIILPFCLIDSDRSPLRLTFPIPRHSWRPTPPLLARLKRRFYRRKYDQSPGGMKSLGTSLAHLAIAAGSYLNSAVLGAIAWATARGGAAGWIPDDLNEGHLDYFWLMAALGVVNLLHFVYCSRRYRGNKTTY
ncbi:protein NRT1/ PTR FAMILY 8.3 [Setaria italica]|nr:protein NRT1/ PTR FAMILY 8.3 [Setaria italica]